MNTNLSLLYKFLARKEHLLSVYENKSIGCYSKEVREAMIESIKNDIEELKKIISFL